MATLAVAVAVAWRRLLDELDPASLLARPAVLASAMRRRIGEAFDRLDPSGVMAEECWTAYSRKLRRWTSRPDAVRAFVEDWDMIRLELEALLEDPSSIAATLRATGAPATFNRLQPSVDRVTAVWALLNGHLIRDRFTMADLAWFAGLWDADRVMDAIDGAAALLSD